MRTLSIAALAAAALVTACGKSEAPPEAAKPAAPVKVLTDAEKAALVASLPAPYNTADIAKGKAQFALCRSCHTITPDGPNMTGPALYGMFGRKVGTHPGYNYSDAAKGAGFTWDAENLDKWLAQPRTFLPGTKMSFAGVKNEQDRIDLIGYLKVETGYQP